MSLTILVIQPLSCERDTNELLLLILLLLLLLLLAAEDWRWLWRGVQTTLETRRLGS